jgi:hypothetical protein
MELTKLKEIIQETINEAFFIGEDEIDEYENIESRYGSGYGSVSRYNKIEHNIDDIADVDDEEESSLEKMRQSMKKEKKKPAIPAELLAGNSYEDKLMVVRYVTEQEQNRVANAIRSMIQITP